MSKFSSCLPASKLNITHWIDFEFQCNVILNLQQYSNRRFVIRFVQLNIWLPMSHAHNNFLLLRLPHSITIIHHNYTPKLHHPCFNQQMWQNQILNQNWKFPKIVSRPGIFVKILRTRVRHELFFWNKILFYDVTNFSQN